MEGLITVKKMNKATANEEAMNLLAKVGLVHVKINGRMLYQEGNNNVSQLLVH